MIKHWRRSLQILLSASLVLAALTLTGCVAIPQGSAYSYQEYDYFTPSYPSPTYYSINYQVYHYPHWHYHRWHHPHWHHHC